MYIYIYIYRIKSRVGTILLQFCLNRLLKVSSTDSVLDTLRSRVRRHCSRIVPTRDLISVISSTFVVSTICNSSIAAFYRGFLFFWPTDCISLDFFQLVWRSWPFLYFFPPIFFFFFPQAVIWDIVISKYWQVFSFIFLVTMNAGR